MPSRSSRTKSSAEASKAGDAPRRAPRPRANAPAVRADGLALLDAAQAGRFPRALYVDGPDEALKAAFLAEFRRTWAVAVPEAAAARVLRPGENDVDEILAAVQNVSLFSPRELVIVIQVEEMSRSEKR